MMQMKKIIIVVGLCLCVGFAAVAQGVEEQSGSKVLVNKKGVAILPKAGDFAIGVDATPLLKYMGHFLSLAGGELDTISGVKNSLTPTNGLSLYGKYFLEDNRAVRVKLNVGYSAVRNTAFIQDDYAAANDPLSVATVADIRKVNKQELGLSVGYEFRYGRGRIQAFYGAEVGFGYTKTNTYYTYGNPMTDVNQAPTSAGWVTTPSSRPVEDKGAATGKIGLGGFAGLEYFIAPQVSIGGEFALQFAYQNQGLGKKTTEQFNAALQQVETIVPPRSGSVTRTIDFKTVPKACLFLMFHF
jgi:hypothetical protein